ncbi:MAG: hypothetical protein JWL71_1143 [Acidobacteria bacterium]|jgi:hypothetical protein|nr:hypothetical protein [Acidobacteriota bacterium]
MPETRPRQLNVRVALVSAASMLVVFGVYWLRLDRVAGLMVDDAWYVLLGRSLALGDGYRLQNSAATAILPVVPPGFPALLSVVFRFSPAFPQNVFLLKGVSIAAMMGVGLCSYRYLVADRHLPRHLSLCIAVATTLTPALVFLATSTVMAECVFTLGQLVTVMVVEQSVSTGDERRGSRTILIAGAIAAATTLVRSTGMALVAAVTLYLLGRQQWRRAVLFCATVTVCLVPWTFYARAHEPTDAQRRAHGGSIVYAYSDSMRMKQAADPESGHVTLSDLRYRVQANVVNVLGRDMGGLFAPALLRGPEESGEEVVALGGLLGLTAGSMGNASATMIVSFVFSAIVLIGYSRTVRTRVTVAELLVPISLAMIVLVPFFTFRYVLPVAPFLFFYLAAGLQAPATSRPARGLNGRGHDPWRVARIVLLCIIGLDVADHAQYIRHATSVAGVVPVDWIADAREIDAVLEWMKRTLPPDGSVATTNPALVYLATGRKTVAIDDYDGNWRRWKAGGVRYAVALRSASLPNPSYGYTVIYQSGRRKLWVIEI